MLCVGLLASADRHPTVLTFDMIRVLIAELVRPEPTKRGLFRRRR
ncbi:hypothetical protein [Asanoa siamensis]|uniref:Uncharacterized protein n=1 Tax=Asanoa siamensis TaxID=926357 RepID=A0ABQ4CXQ4_9ACTN|nr:hypothetical protein [Asanoa siamensis]GIF76068.1 hypothetical protein Asi02nite_55860 [Asanoa siamensis]